MHQLEIFHEKNHLFRKQEGHSGPKSLTWVACWSSDLVFNPTWPSFKLDLPVDIMMINILTKFHDIKTKLCTLECTKGFSKIWPSDLYFYPTWPSFDPDLDIMMINILTKFHELELHLCPLECTQGFSKIWPSNLTFDPTWPDFKLDLDIIMINFLT